MIQDPQIVSMFLDPPLYFLEQVPDLHADDKGRHGQENVAPEKHVKMMHEVQEQDGQLEDELCVVCEQSSLLPDRAGAGIALPHVVQMESIAQDDVEGPDVKLDALRKFFTSLPT